jgi:DNA-binding beta-propeller fold protein YncE
MDSKGQVEGAVTGLNISSTFGGVHVLAVDEQRRALWVVENVGRRLWHFDLASGKLLQQTPLPGVTAAAIDPATGNVWCTISGGGIGKGNLQVISPAGKPVATYPIAGLDIAYSRQDRSFWVVSKDVSKVSLDGKVLDQITGQIPWCAVSVSVDQKTGSAWVVVRAHPQVVDSKDGLWIVDKNVKVQKRIDLEELAPSCVAVDSENGVAWVGCGSTTLHFTTGGEKLKSARLVPGFSVAPGASGSSVVAANQGGLTIATVRDTGYVELGGPPREVRDLLSSSQKWVAIVPWAGAKLASSPELVNLALDKDAGLRLADYPESAKRLETLGKALLLYANDYNDKFPDALEGVRSSVGEADMRWLMDNVEYLGKGKTVAGRPDVAVAYDKTVLRKGAGTLVLYLDCHVAFEGPHKLDTLGIKLKP